MFSKNLKAILYMDLKAPAGFITPMPGLLPQDYIPSLYNCVLPAGFVTPTPCGLPRDCIHCTVTSKSRVYCRGILFTAMSSHQSRVVGHPK